MAPTSDDVIASLKDTVSALEKKVEDLEAKLSGKASGGSSSSGSDMRMILMGMLDRMIYRVCVLQPNDC